VSLKSRLRRLEAQATALPSPEWVACEFLYQHLSLRQQRLLLEVLEAATEHRPLPYGLAPAEMERVFEGGITILEQKHRIDALVRRLEALAPPRSRRSCRRPPRSLRPVRRPAPTSDPSSAPTRSRRGGNRRTRSPRPPDWFSRPRTGRGGPPCSGSKRSSGGSCAEVVP
jgi:hypothetical protein